MNQELTFVVTSCNRHVLLEKTLRSFVEHNTYPITETIIIEDGPTPEPDFVRQLSGLGRVSWIQNGRRIGQLKSIDKAYALVSTEYLHHSEDDWLTVSGNNFIQRSINILEKHPKIWTVSLRADKCNGHPMQFEQEYPGIWMQQPNWGSGWGSFNLNCGVRRLADYKAIGSNYYKIAGDAPAPKPEWFLSIAHRDLGYRIAALPEEISIHLGEECSRARETFK